MWIRDGFKKQYFGKPEAQKTKSNNSEKTGIDSLKKIVNKMMVLLGEK